MELKDNRWLIKAKCIGVGTNQRFRHCGTTDAGVVYNAPDRWSFYCHRCKESAQVHKAFATPPIKEEVKNGAPVPADLIPFEKCERHIQGMIASFLLKKGIDINLIPMELYYSERTHRFLIPQRTSPRGVVSALGRTLHPNLTPKWVMYGARVDYLQYGYNGWKNVIFTEDYLSALKVHFVADRLQTNGEIPLVSVVPLFGTGINATYRGCCIAENSNVMLMLDGDIAGYSANEKIAQKLRGFCKVHVCDIPEGYDPKDLSINSIELRLRDWFGVNKARA